MKNPWVLFLILSLLCVVLEGFFSMFEMASITLNRVRLQYYASKNYKRAKWLAYLLEKPYRLFGTTLIAVNTVLQIGSECARRFYESLGVSADYAPISQILLVIIFGELAPLFAARRHSEHVALFGIVPIYFISKILTPFTYIISLISKAANSAFGGAKKKQFLLSKEELRKAFEYKKSSFSESAEEEMTLVVDNIFSLKTLIAKNVMDPLETILMVSTSIKIKDIKKLLKKDDNFTPIIIYHHHFSNVVAITFPRELLNAKDDERVINYSEAPWFVTQNTKITALLNQFKNNNQRIAVVINPNGKAIGIITLDMIVDEIFTSSDFDQNENIRNLKKSSKTIIEKTLSGDVLVIDFNKKYVADFKISDDKEKTLSDLLCEEIGHHPSKDEIVSIGSFEFIVKEPSMLGVKTLIVRSIK
jgi:putative hemolysin